MGDREEPNDTAPLTGFRGGEAKAKLCCIKSDEVAVAFGPPARDKVITEAAKCPVLGILADSGPLRHSPYWLT
jgi:hypothetical protein